MIIIEEKKSLLKTVNDWRTQHCKIALVPTMGNLHAGHLSLIQKAKDLADKVLVSIFVNPLQFGANEDLDTYPRTLEADLVKLNTLKVDAVFLPSVETIYPEGKEKHTFVEVPELSQQLCGKTRPVFFRGIATIVTMLFNLTQPAMAVFGEKDYQQLFIIKKLVRDLAIPVTIISSPIVREADGLAMSSRNHYLTKEERAKAPLLYHTLCQVKHSIEMHNTSFAIAITKALDQLTSAGFHPDYVEIRRQQDLAPATEQDYNLLILAAVSLGKTRLIDNLKVKQYE